ncbi:unnamed protein product [Medioppia subpectinata]|uniref:Uncharacterized protein n=1 Tax=Medioppia subpectinata TaxID=1979941 RepID=A0A7R9Q4P1_9ACAR|nr:unnamed protein product [Medioppia subpectinata]CAG2111912.1 unnamed protein product [Medioppia subpectinata]
MKVAIVLCAFVGVSLAIPYESYGKAVNTGRSQVMRKDDGHGNYEFGYDEDHSSGGTSRREKGGKGWQTGSYELRDKDGRKRTVKYVADAHGFRAQVDTNEPGVDSKEDPADVNINKNGYGIQYAQPITTYIAKAEPQIITYAKSYDNGYDNGNYGGDYGKGWGSGYSSSWDNGNSYGKW